MRRAAAAGRGVAAVLSGGAGAATSAGSEGARAAAPVAALRCTLAPAPSTAAAARGANRGVHLAARPAIAAAARSKHAAAARAGGPRRAAREVAARGGRHDIGELHVEDVVARPHPGNSVEVGADLELEAAAGAPVEVSLEADALVARQRPLPAPRHEVARTRRAHHRVVPGAPSSSESTASPARRRRRRSLPMRSRLDTVPTGAFRRRRDLLHRVAEDEIQRHRLGDRLRELVEEAADGCPSPLRLGRRLRRGLRIGGRGVAVAGVARNPSLLRTPSSARGHRGEHRHARGKLGDGALAAEARKRPEELDHRVLRHVLHLARAEDHAHPAPDGAAGGDHERAHRLAIPAHHRRRQAREVVARTPRFRRRGRRSLGQREHRLLSMTAGAGSGQGRDRCGSKPVVGRLHRVVLVDARRDGAVRLPLVVKRPGPQLPECVGSQKNVPKPTWFGRSKTMSFAAGARRVVRVGVVFGRSRT